jgi:glutathione S-transferase
MTLRLHYHPLASYCHKVLIALYENGTPFEAAHVDLGDPVSRAAFEALWPKAKMPVLEDADRGCTVPESSVIIEYLDTYYPGPARFVPADPEAAWQVHLWDRVFDNYLHEPMQRIVGDRLRPADSRDPYGVRQAEDQIRQAYAILEQRMASQTWAAGEAFTLADCSAAPPLFYASTILPLGEGERHVAAYLARLMARPSYARVLAEAEPYFAMFPMERKPTLTPP